MRSLIRQLRRRGRYGRLRAASAVPTEIFGELSKIQSIIYRNGKKWRALGCVIPRPASSGREDIHATYVGLTFLTIPEFF